MRDALAHRKSLPRCETRTPARASLISAMGLWPGFESAASIGVRRVRETSNDKLLLLHAGLAFHVGFTASARKTLPEVSPVLLDSCRSRRRPSRFIQRSVSTFPSVGAYLGCNVQALLMKRSYLTDAVGKSNENRPSKGNNVSPAGYFRSAFLTRRESSQ